MMRSLMLYRMEWCEKHPGLMLSAVGAMILLAGALEKVMP